MLRFTFQIGCLLWNIVLVRRSYIRIRPTSLACYKPYVMFLNDVINNKLLSYDTFEEKAERVICGTLPLTFPYGWFSFHFVFLNIHFLMLQILM